MFVVLYAMARHPGAPYGRRYRLASFANCPPTLPEWLIGPAGLDAIVEVSLRQVRVPELALLLIVLMDVGIAAVQSRRALRTLCQRVMDHVSRVAGRPERLVDAFR